MFKECREKACKDQVGHSQCWENMSRFVYNSVQCLYLSKGDSSSGWVVQHGESKVVLCCGWTATKRCYREFVCMGLCTLLRDSPCLIPQMVNKNVQIQNIEQGVDSKKIPEYLGRHTVYS